MQMCLILKAQLLRAVPSCLQRKNEQEVSATSFVRCPSKTGFQGPQLWEPLPAIPREL